MSIRLFGKSLLLVCLLALLTFSASAQQSFSPSVYVYAKVVAPLTLTSYGDMNFGSVIPHSSLDGWVALNPDGTRTSSNAMIGNTAGVSPATFGITAEPGSTVAVTVPSEITLTGPGGNTLLLNFISTNFPGNVGTINNSGVETVRVGGYLRLPGGAQTGNYSGLLGVTIAYN
jgi:hypothetical protein